MKTAIINTNLARGGKSAALADEFLTKCSRNGIEAEIFHLCDRNLPHCDGKTCYQNPETVHLLEQLADQDAIVLISPIYNYDLNAAAKNLIELTGNSWKGKAVGLICTAGGDRSYLAPLSFMNSLAVDYRCLVSPRFIYVTREDFSEENTIRPDSPVQGRLSFLAAEMLPLSEAAQAIAQIGGNQTNKPRKIEE